MKNEEQKKLYKMLSVINEVTSYRWDIITTIVKSITTNMATGVIKKEWNNYKKDFPDYYPLDLSKISTWSTYDNCFHLRFYYHESHLYCDTIIYEGDNFDGHRKDKRFTAKLILPHEFITYIESEIKYKFNCYLDDCYEKNEEEKRNRWKTKKAKELLK